MTALGQSGLKGFRTGFIWEEFLSELRGQNGARRYRELADNDPVIGAMMFAITMLVRKVEWQLEARDKAADALDAQEFFEQVLFEDMEIPFADVVEEALSMIVYGYAPFEVIYKVRAGEQPDMLPRGATNLGDWVNYANRPMAKPSSLFDDRRIGIHQIAIRGQESIYQWFFDKAGRWVAFHQQLEDGGNVIIPRYKALLFKTQAIKGNPEGRSVLRNAYILYQRKKVLEAAEGRFAIRQAGVYEFKIPGKYLASDADESERLVRNQFEAMAKDFAADKRGAVVLPSDRDDKGNALYELSIKSPSSGASGAGQIGSIVERYDKRIAGTVLADFILLGQGSTGSFALSADKTELFGEAIKGFLVSIASVLNRELLPRLAKLNNIDAELIPILKPGDIEKASLDQLSALLTSLTGAGATVFPDEKLENHIRGLANLPLRDKETDAEQEEAKAGAFEEQQALLQAKQPQKALKPGEKAPPAEDEELDEDEDE